MKTDREEKKYLFDRPGNVKWFLRLFYLSILLLVVIDLFIQKHPYFPWEGYPSFYGAFALAASFALVLGASYIFRKIVRREETYYD